MNGLRIGELFAGYGGLGMGVMAVLGGDIAWVSEIDRGACKVLAHRYPDAPNHGDVTTIDWARVESVDILTGGFPCQDLSTAGKRAGMRPGTRSGLWSHFAYAISQLRPPLVVIENVRGLLSAEAHSDVEPCPWCLGDDPGDAMRALGAVLADLADIGYDAIWCGLRAADVGGCHGRFRVFIAAYPAGSGREWWPAQLGGASGHAATAVASDIGHERSRPARDGRARPADGGLLHTPTTRDHKGHNQRRDDTCLTGALLPTPRATDGAKGGPNQRGSSGDLMLPSAVAKLLPTPAVNDMGAGKTPEDWDAWTARMKAEHDNGNGHGASLSIEALRLPTAMDRASSGGGYNGQTNVTLTDATVRQPDRWGDYAAAITRWEHTLGRPAPDPTEPNPKTGRPRLSARFEEWMMGLPAGWITDVPDVTWQEAVRMCGNGVVPQQASAALSWLLNQLATKGAA